MGSIVSKKKKRQTIWYRWVYSCGILILASFDID
jgi:hypothetical protein